MVRVADRGCTLRSGALDLAGDGSVFDLRVVGEHEGFADDDREGGVAFEREEDIVLRGA
jgi:hypothetical protein